MNVPIYVLLEKKINMVDIQYCPPCPLSHLTHPALETSGLEDQREEHVSSTLDIYLSGKRLPPSPKENCMWLQWSLQRAQDTVLSMAASPHFAGRSPGL